MLCVDVNVLVYAHRGEFDEHAAALAWLDAARAGPEPLGVPGVVLSGFVRLVTDARVFAGPTPLAEAVGFVRTLLGSPSVRLLVESRSQCERFLDLCTAADARGQRVPDAWLAALAIDHGATLMTSDRGFARYPGLRWRHPLDG